LRSISTIVAAELPDGYTYTSTAEVVGDRLPSLTQPVFVAADAEAAA